MVSMGWSRIGERLREARTVAGQTQQQLAEKIGVDRSAIVRVEAGERKLDAIEIYQIARVLGLPLSYFLAESPIAAVSRRAALSDDVTEAERTQWLLDVDLGAHARDAAWLHEHGLLPQVATPHFELRSEEDARRAAVALRSHIGLAADRPVGGMAAACEAVGLYVLSVARLGDGASMDCGGYGVAVIAGRAEPGRRRATAAHELGHFVSGDAYSSDIGVADRSDAERWIDAFASEFLLPRSAMAGALTDAGPDDLWTRLLIVAGRFRVSWRLAVRTADAVREVDVAGLLARTPLAADFRVHLGEEPEQDLAIGQTGPAWRRSVLEAHRGSLLTVERAAELLHGALSYDEIRAVVGRDPS